MRTYIMFWSEAWALIYLRIFCLHFYLYHVLRCDRLSFHHLLTIFLGSAAHLHCKEVKQWSYRSEAKVVVGSSGNIVCVVCWGSVRFPWHQPQEGAPKERPSVTQISLHLPTGRGPPVATRASILGSDG